MIDFLSIACQIGLRRKSRNCTDDKSTLDHGLVQWVNKPLAESMLTQLYDII